MRIHSSRVVYGVFVLGLISVATVGARANGAPLDAQEPSRAELLARRRVFGAPILYFYNDGSMETWKADPGLRDAILAGTSDLVPKPEEEQRYYNQPGLYGWWQRNLMMFRKISSLAYNYELAKASHWSQPFIARANGGELVTMDVDVPEAGDYYAWVLVSGNGCISWPFHPGFPGGSRFERRSNSTLLAGPRYDLQTAGGNYLAVPANLRNPLAWYWSRLTADDAPAYVPLPAGKNTLRITSIGGGTDVRLAAVMLVRTTVDVDPRAPAVPEGKGIIAVPMRQDDPRIHLGQGAVWKQESAPPPEVENYAQAAIRAVTEIGKYYLKYPRVTVTANNTVLDLGPDSSPSGLGYVSMREAWMMDLFVPTWDHMRFWDVMTDDE